MGNLSPHFSAIEFWCHCGCQSLPMAPALIAGLEELRLRTKHPIRILSGYRCATHNKAVGGTPRSQHLKAQAADITSNYHTADELAALAEQIAVFEQGGIGIYPKRRFVHLDVGPRRRWVL